MRRTIMLSALLSLAAATAAVAQPGGGPQRGPGGPGGPGGHPGPPPSTADFLLGHTGELGLTDAQVTRLAGIARRVHQQHEAERAQMRRDTARRGRPDQAEMERHRAQATAERRDALAVLTADQQAEAFDLIQRGPGGPGRGAPGAPPLAPGGRGPEGDRGRGGERPERD